MDVRDSFSMRASMEIKLCNMFVCLGELSVIADMLVSVVLIRRHKSNECTPVRACLRQQMTGTEDGGRRDRGRRVGGQ